MTRKASEKDAPIAQRLAVALRIAHARGDGGVHAGAAAPGCPTCQLLREARAAGLIEGPWPSAIAWDGQVFNNG